MYLKKNSDHLSGLKTFLFFPCYLSIVKKLVTKFRSRDFVSFWRILFFFMGCRFQGSCLGAINHPKRWLTRWKFTAFCKEGKNFQFVYQYCLNRNSLTLAKFNLRSLNSRNLCGWLFLGRFWSNLPPCLLCTLQLYSHQRVLLEAQEPVRIGFQYNVFAIPLRTIDQFSGGQSFVF